MSKIFSISVIFLLCVCLFRSELFCQNQIDSKLRVILYNTNSIDLSDNCILYIYHEGKLINEIDLSSVQERNDVGPEERLFLNITIEPNNYIALLTGIRSSTIIFTGIKIKKNRMHFLPINIEELRNKSAIKPPNVVIDYIINLKEYENY